MKMAGDSIWTAVKLKRIAEKYGTDVVYVCRKNGCDAAAVIIERHTTVVRLSRVAPADDAFKSKFSIPQDIRRLDEKMGFIKDGVLHLRAKFTTPAKAAQFVSAKHSARACDWKKVYVGQ